MYKTGDCISILRFISGHNHLREGEILKPIVHAERFYSYLIAMGNLSVPTNTADLALAYATEIKLAGAKFTPIPTLMLNKRTTPEIIREAATKGIKAVKFVPGSTSVNSDEGISFFDIMGPKGYSLMDAIVTSRMLFSVHAELINLRSGEPINEFDRCARALPFLEEIIFYFGEEIRMVIEHANDRQTIEFVRQTSREGLNVWATIRPHDTILTYDDVCTARGEIIFPGNYAKPIAKTEDDRVAALEAMVSGEDCFFYGPDSAPHQLPEKMTVPKAGIFIPSIYGIPLVVQTFERTGMMRNLKTFTVDVARQVYGLPEVTQTLTLVKKRQRVPETYYNIPLFLGGRMLDWQIA